MKLIKALAFSLLLSVFSFAKCPSENNDTSSEIALDIGKDGICFKFNKEDFHESLKVPENIIMEYTYAQILS